MVRNTPPDHIDYEQLQYALKKIKNVTDFVNDNKRKAENLQKILSIQSSLHGKIRVVNILFIKNINVFFSLYFI